MRRRNSLVGSLLVLAAASFVGCERTTAPLGDLTPTIPVTPDIADLPSAVVNGPGSFT